jgi:hypothetical protein
MMQQARMVFLVSGKISFEPRQCIAPSTLSILFAKNQIKIRIKIPIDFPSPIISVVDPGRVGSETFSKIRIRIQIREKSYRIRELRIRNEFEEKLLKKVIKVDNFLTKMVNLKT